MTEQSGGANPEAPRTPDKPNQARNEGIEIPIPHGEFIGNGDSLFGHAEPRGEDAGKPAVFPFTHKDLVPFHTLPFGDIGQEQNIALVNPSNDRRSFGWPLVHASTILLHFNKEMARFVQLFAPIGANPKLEIVRCREKQHKRNRQTQTPPSRGPGEHGGWFLGV